MNIDQVRAMIDAIHKREDHVIRAEVSDGWPSMIAGFSSDEILFDIEGSSTKMSDPTFARQLAGALILWANKQEGIRPENGDEMETLIKFCALFDVVDDTHPVNNSRADWYARMTPLMTVETLKRNRADLNVIAKELAKSHAPAARTELADINRAIDYIHHELKKKGEK